MDIQQTKDLMKEAYVKAGFQLVDEHTQSLELFFKHPRGREVVRLAEQEIREYAETETVRATFKKIPTECAICSSTYREHMLDYLEEGSRRSVFIRDSTFVFGETTGIHAQIGTASNIFCDFFRFDEA